MTSSSSKPARSSIGTLLVALVLTTAACAGAPPTGWTSGGQPMLMPHARWVNGELLVDLDPRGRVWVGGRHLFSVDASGRVYDASNAPVALLQRDGMLLGTGDTPMGWVGAGEAILPGEEHSWLRLHPSGLLIRNDGDDDTPFGQWLGCNQMHTVQTCMLVSHIIGRELMAKRGQGQSLGLFTSGVTMGSGFITP